MVITPQSTQKVEWCRESSMKTEIDRDGKTAHVMCEKLLSLAMSENLDVMVPFSADAQSMEAVLIAGAKL